MTDVGQPEFSVVLVRYPVLPTPGTTSESKAESSTLAMSRD